VKFKLKEKPKGAPDAENYYLIAWTTTPWTLPSNLALAVSSTLSYLSVVEGDAHLWMEQKAAFAFVKQNLQKDKIETTRCVMRPFVAEDLPLLLSLHKHEKVAETTYDGMENDEQIAAHLNDFIEHQAKLGYSQWAVFDKASGAFIGRCGISRRHVDTSRDPQPEIRCALLPEYWGKGIATECCYAWLQRFFATQTIDAIAGAATPASVGGRAMLEGLGYVHEKDLTLKGMACPFFQLTRDDFVAANGRRGEALIGLTYEPLFPYFADTKNAFRILDGSSFVTEGDGTGVVHIAPGFGEDDFNLAAKNDVPVVVPVDGRGFYTSEVGDLAGLHVIWDEASNHKNTGNEAVLRKLKDKSTTTRIAGAPTRR
jgi:isoleucyl-tRNA synthetase